MKDDDESARSLVSVVIATRNRAEMLRESLHSVLCQTYRRLEVLVIDDGSEDDTEDVVASLADPRLRYLRQEHAGISAARNLGTESATGDWIAVHDDDDIMLPDRIERQLRVAGDDVDFIYGAFINFDDETGALELHHGRNYGYGPALMSGFAPGHSTWLVRSDVMRLFPYDEGIRSAVDNNVVFRMLRAGVRFRHSGVICLLRRVHSGRITTTGGASQKYVAGMNLAFLSRGVPSAGRQKLVKEARRDWGPVDKSKWQARNLPYLPDHLVKRSGYESTVERSEAEGGAGEIVLTNRPVAEMDWWEFYEVCSRGHALDGVRARLRESDEIERAIAGGEITEELDVPEPFLQALEHLVDAVPEGSRSGYLAVASGAPNLWADEQLQLCEARCRVVQGPRQELLGIVATRSLESAHALRERVFPAGANIRVFSLKKPQEIAADLDS